MIVGAVGGQANAAGDLSSIGATGCQVNTAGGSSSVGAQINTAGVTPSVASWFQFAPFLPLYHPGNFYQGYSPFDFSCPYPYPYQPTGTFHPLEL